MKKGLIYCMAVVVCGIGVLTGAQFYNKRTKKVTVIVEQRDTSGIDPFTIATRVELVTYNSNRMDWWFDGGEGDKPLLQDGILNIPTDRIHSRIQLEPAVVVKWHDALYVRNFCEDSVIALCYEPRHMLTFYNADNQLFGCIEVCLSCSGGQVSPGLRAVDFCLERVEYLAGLDPIAAEM